MTTLGRRDRMRVTFVLLSVFYFASSSPASADHKNSEKTSRNAFTFDAAQILNRENFDRTLAVLKHFGAPAEASAQPTLQQLDGLQSREGIDRILPFLDPKNEFSRFTTLTADLIDGFQDLDSKQVGDFSVRLAPAGIFTGVLPLPPLVNPKLPLQGMRIALDPGHMGGDLWDD